jgi:stearoyl-CoA desaturase (delta-9 desaturase)
VAIHALVLVTIFYSWNMRCACVFVLTYVAKTFGVSAGYHRYFSHRAFKTSRLGQFALAFLAGMAMQNGPLWWAAHHRIHHRHSDRPGDPHSPGRDGFWWSQVFWIFAHREKRLDEVRDLARFPELVWLDRYNFLPAVLLGAFLWVVFGFPEFLWGFAASTVVCWHTSSAVNSLGHRWGSRPYETGDASTNHWLLALLSLGDGWHNNHHRYAASARHGFRPWELDITYGALRVLESLGLVSDLKPVPSELLEGAVFGVPRPLRDDSR